MTLRDNIGTFAKEDEAFNLLTKLSWQLPIFVITSALLDLILAFVYLKWLHPWRIILQVSFCFLVAQLNRILKEPENRKYDHEQGKNNPVMEKVCFDDWILDL